MADYLCTFAASADHTLAFIHTHQRPYLPALLHALQSHISELPGAGDRDCWWLLVALEPEDAPSTTCHPRRCCEEAGMQTAWRCVAKPFSWPPWAAAKVGQLVSPSGGAGDTAVMWQTPSALKEHPGKKLPKPGLWEPAKLQLWLGWVLGAAVL